jgi:ATP-dependent exoDNAse (exonuclease V) beta subunit
VQETILAEQAEKGGSGRVREPSLFIVGDRKQSIYGWREARVEVMEKAARRLLKIRGGGGQRLTLQTSFRSNGNLLSFLNDVFDEIPKVRGDLDWSFQYRDEDHFPVAETEDALRPVGVALGDELSSVAAAVADEVVRVLSEEGRRPKDIAILFRSRASYRSYEQALVERGVPAYVYRGLGFFDSAEMRDLEALVRYLAEPASELRAAELARSRFVAISDAALVRMTAGRKRSLADWLSRGEFASGVQLTPEDAEAVTRAQKRVTTWLEWVDRIPPADVLERILGDTDYAAWFVDQEQSWENLKKVLQIVRRAQNRGYLTVSRLADYLASARTEEESPAVLEAVDAVNLMTVHAAKGLEFDTVFLVNMHQRTRQDTSLPRIRELPDGRVEVSALAAMENDEHVPNRVEEEEKRLLYVALTRARRNLVLSAVMDDEAQNERSFLRLLPASLCAVFESARGSGEPELIWRTHPIRVLKPVEGRTYREQRPERARRLDMEPDQSLLGRPTIAFDDRGTPELYRQLLRGHDLDGDISYRIPFSIVEGDHVTRGVIGCLVVNPNVVTVVEDGTLASSTARVKLSLRAASAAFPGREVRGLLLSEDAEPRLIGLEDGPNEQRPLF